MGKEQDDFGEPGRNPAKQPRPADSLTMEKLAGNGPDQTAVVGVPASGQASYRLRLDPVAK